MNITPYCTTRRREVATALMPNLFRGHHEIPIRNSFDGLCFSGDDVSAATQRGYTRAVRQVHDATLRGRQSSSYLIIFTDGPFIRDIMLHVMISRLISVCA